MKQEHGTACVEAINDFRQSHGLLPLAVCSRTADYDALAQRLRLQDAIVVRPLTQPQVDSYLTEIGPAGSAVREAIRHDPCLRDLLDTPLMLYIVIVAYAGGQDPQFQASGSVEQRRDRLFAAYVDQMFRRRGADLLYSQQQTVNWLKWLAWQMVQHSQTVFYIEQLQFDWLLQQRQWFIRASYSLAVGVVGGFLGLVIELVATGLGGRVYLVRMLGFVATLGFAGLIIGTLTPSIKKPIKTIESIKFSFKNLNILSLKSIARNAFFGLVLGLVIWIVTGTFNVLIEEWGLVLFTGLIFGIAFGLVGLLSECLAVSGIELRTAPNQGIHRSARNSLIVGLFDGLVVGLFFGLFFGLSVFWMSHRLDFGLSTALMFMRLVGPIGGLVGGLTAGGRAFFMHLILRRLLVRNGSAPWHYARFLDHAAERILVRKVGGGYMFIHRMLMEYFAARYEGAIAEKGSTANLSSIEPTTPSLPLA